MNPTFATPTNRRSFLRTSAHGLGGLFCGTLFSAEKEKPKEAKGKTERFSHYNDAVLVAGEPPAIAEGSYTIVALPDTQKYAKANPAGFLAQTEWIATNHKSRNIACALHLGDITDNNKPEQWELAVKAMKRLDGEVPYFMVLGNHDYSANGSCVDRTTLFNDYFPLSAYSKAPTFGGVYDKEPTRFENSYHLLSASGKDLLVLCLEFGPRKDVVRWANQIVSKHHNRAAILVTHAYMYFDDTRFDHTKYASTQSWNPHHYKIAASTNDDVSDGEELWTNLVSKHPNFIMTLNGHVLEDGLGRLTSKAGTRDVHQMLFNCQMRPNGGDGWMRVIEVKSNGTAEVCDFSPFRKERNEAAENKFTLQLAAVV
ncbi:MAG: metallophosphoesterase [Prosthecobacter sp.]